MSIWVPAFSTCGSIHRSGIAGLHGNSVFNILRNGHYCFPRRLYHCTFPSAMHRVPVAPLPCQHYFLSLEKITATLIGVKYLMHIFKYKIVVNFLLVLNEILNSKYNIFEHLEAFLKRLKILSICEGAIKMCKSPFRVTWGKILALWTSLKGLETPRGSPTSLWELLAGVQCWKHLHSESVFPEVDES